MRNIILSAFAILGLFTAGCVYETPYGSTFTPYTTDYDYGYDSDVIYTTNNYYVENYHSSPHYPPPPKPGTPGHYQDHNDHHNHGPGMPPSNIHGNPSPKPNNHVQPGKPGKPSQTQPGKPSQTQPGKPSQTQPGKPHHSQQGTPSPSQPRTPSHTNSPKSGNSRR